MAWGNGDQCMWKDRGGAQVDPKGGWEGMRGTWDA